MSFALVNSHIETIVSNKFYFFGFSIKGKWNLAKSLALFHPS